MDIFTPSTFVLHFISRNRMKSIELPYSKLDEITSTNRIPRGFKPKVERKPRDKKAVGSLYELTRERALDIVEHTEKLIANGNYLSGFPIKYYNEIGFNPVLDQHLRGSITGLRARRKKRDGRWYQQIILAKSKEVIVPEQDVTELMELLQLQLVDVYTCAINYEYKLNLTKDEVADLLHEIIKNRMSTSGLPVMLRKHSIVQGEIKLIVEDYIRRLDEQRKGK